jgi:hypothetical protein
VNEFLKTLAALVVAVAAVIGALQALGVIDVRETSEAIGVDDGGGNGGGGDGHTDSGSTTTEPEFRVTDATVLLGAPLTEDPPSYVGPCPVLMTLTGSITAEGATGGSKVSFHFVHDEEPLEDQELTFDESGSQSADEELSVSASGSIGLEVVSPNEVSASPVPFTINCLD